MKDVAKIKLEIVTMFNTEDCYKLVYRLHHEQGVINGIWQ